MTYIAPIVQLCPYRDMLVALHQDGSLSLVILRANGPAEIRPIEFEVSA